METMQARCYHVIKFLIAPDALAQRDFCIPASWIVKEDKNNLIILVAYPNEPWQITMQRVKNYENLSEGWELYLAEKRYSMDYYDGIIRYVNEHQDCVPEYKPPKGTQIKPPLSTDFSKVASTQLNRETTASSAGFSIFDRSFCQFHSFLNQWYLMMLMMNKSMIPEFKLLGEMMDPFKLYCNAERNAAHAPASQNRFNRERRQKDLDDDNLLFTSEESDSKLTLKHREYSPGLVALMPKRSIYIDRAELENCKKYSKRSTQLARRLMKHVFTASALKMCSLTKKKMTGRLQLKLDQHAIGAIVDFVLQYGRRRNWAPVNVSTIKDAIRRELKLSKKHK